MSGREPLALYSDAPIPGARFDALARLPVAEQLVALVTLSPERPLVIALCGGAGTGKTSVLYMAGELLAARADLRAFAIDAWIAGDAAHVNEALLREVAQIFEEEKVVGKAEKVRDRLIDVGDYVSAVVRLAGVKVDVKSAFEKSPDQLRDEVIRLTEASRKRIVVMVDHLDRLPPTEALAVLKLIARWGAFPYFAFVLGLDRDQMVHALDRVDGDADDLDRIVGVDLPLPPVDRAELAAWVRGGLADLAAALGVDAAPALGLFEVETGVGLGLVTTLRAAKRLLNTLAAALPLAGAGVELRAAVLLELVRQHVPRAYPVIAERLPLASDGSARARLAADVGPEVAQHPRHAAAAAVVDALLGAP